MKATLLLLATLLTGSTASELSDLCQESVLLNPATGQPLMDLDGTMLSSSCAWAGPDAPVWADTACCTVDSEGSSCVAPDEREQCPSGFSPYYCEYGEPLAGGLLCYQSFPSACQLSSCSHDPQVQSPEDVQEDVICCIFGTCYEWDDLLWEDCEGWFGWCDNGYSKVDGTVECFD